MWNVLKTGCSGGDPFDGVVVTVLDAGKTIEYKFLFEEIVALLPDAQKKLYGHVVEQYSL